MPAARLSTRAMRQAYELVVKHREIRAAAAEAGVCETTFKSRYKAAVDRLKLPAVTLKALAPKLPAAPPPAPEGFQVTGHAVRLDADGAVVGETIRSAPARGEVFEPPAGHEIKGVSALVDGEGRTIAQWIKTREGHTGALVTALRDAFAEWKGAAPRGDWPDVTRADLLTVYPVADLHVGMLAWAPDAGADYDLRIAEQRLREAVVHLVSQSRPAENAVILVLGDYFHTNDQRNATPNSGHRLDVDGRWPKVFAAGARMMLEMVARVLEKHRHVELVIIPGNHDPDAAVSLSVALSIYFAHEPRVTMNEHPLPVWYRRHGRVLLGATHGHTMKPARMAMMLAADRPADWGATAFRHFFFGHIHHESAKEVGPVRVESFGTLAGRDAWAQHGGWRPGQAMSAITYCRERGEIGRHRVNVAAEGRPRVRVKQGRAA